MKSLRGVTIAKNATLNLVGVLASFGIATLTTIVFARQMGVKPFGIYSTLLWLLTTLTMFVGMGTSTTITKSVAELSGTEELDRRASVTSFALSMILAVSLLVLILTATTYRLVGSALHLPDQYHAYILLVALTAIFVAVANALSATLVGLHRFDQVAIGSVIIGAATLGLGWLLLATGQGVSGALVAVLIGYVASTIIYSWLVIKNGIYFLQLPRLDSILRQRFVRYTLVAGGIVLIDAVVWERSEVFFLSRYSGPEQTGFYSLAFGISTAFMTIGLGSLTGVLTPLISAQNAAAQRRRMQETFVASTRYLAMLVLPAAAVMIALASPLIQLLYGSDFRLAAAPFQILLLGATAGALGRVSAAYMYGTDTHAFILKAGVLLAAVNIALDVLLIPRQGAVGASWANTTTQILAGLVGTVYVCRTQEITFPWQSLLRIGGAAMAGGSVAGWVSVSIFPLGLRIVAGASTGSLVAIFLLFVLGELASEDLVFAHRIVKQFVRAT